MYEYAFIVKAVHDGDTVRGTLDLGFYLRLDTALRMHGIDAPELTVTVAGHRTLNPAGEDSTLHLMQLLGGRERFAAKRLAPTFGIPGDYLALPGQEPVIVVRTRLVAGDGDTEKYGRCLGQVTLNQPAGPLDVNAAMVADGFAVPYA